MTEVATARLVLQANAEEYTVRFDGAPEMSLGLKIKAGTFTVSVFGKVVRHSCAL